jgi:hypothetical protein
MIVWSLYADLCARGIYLSTIGDGSKLRVKAPPGALNETMRRAIQDHKADLTDFCIELEETAAILEEQGNTPEQAKALARECVTGGTATPDGELWLRAYAHLELERMGLGDRVEIVSVERLREPAERSIAV